MITNLSLSYFSPNYPHMTGSVDSIPLRDISFLCMFARDEVFLHSNKVISLCREHGITMPVVELNYTNYPFKITVCILTSIVSWFSNDKLCQYCGIFEASAAQTEGTQVVINLQYPAGQSLRVISSTVFTKPFGDLGTINPDLGRMLDCCYTFRVKP
jgi:hypothetical protein